MMPVRTGALCRAKQAFMVCKNSKYFFFTASMGIAIGLTLFASSSQARPVVHRAVEAAQILLDITLDKENLTLYLTIPEMAVPLIGHKKNPLQMIQSLTDSAMLWQANGDAQCSLQSHRIIAGEPQSFDKTTLYKTKGQPDGDIQGFYDFNCLNPEALTTIKPRLKNTLPGLKQLNVWLTTEQWQDKQSLTMPDGIIHLQPDS